MPLQHHEDHVVLIPRTVPHRTKVMLWACVGSAMLFVLLGWVWSLSRTLPSSFAGAGQALSEVVSTAGEARDDVLPRITTRLGNAQDGIAGAMTPYIEAVDERRAAVEAAAALTKQKIESQKSYGE